MVLDLPTHIDLPEQAALLNFRKLVDGMETPYMAMDCNLAIVYANPAYLASVERRWDEIAGRYLFDVFPDKPERVDAVRKIFLETLTGVTTKLERQEYRHKHPDGSISTKCWQCNQTPYFDGSGQVAFIIQHAEDITEAEKLRRRNEAISLELDHRVKNVFAVVQAVAALAGHNSNSVNSFRDDFEGRIMSMARTHDSLSRTDWEGLTLRQIMEAELGQYRGFEEGRVAFHGADIKLNPRASQLASLLAHEFGTNAAKYGCFSDPNGRLDVTAWAYPQQKSLKIEWKESGLQGITAPTTTGFGTRLESFMPNVTIEREFEDDGLRITIRTVLLETPLDYLE